MYRVIWQYQPKAIGKFAVENLLNPAVRASSTRSLFAGLPLIGAVEPVFRGPAVQLRAELRALTPAAATPKPLLDLAGFAHAFVPDLAVASQLQERLLNDPEVLSVQIQPQLSPAFRLSRNGPAPAPLTTASLNPAPTRDLRSEQGYLNPAPLGVDAAAAWARPGGKGSGITVIDIEYGWNFLHEDLRQVQGGVVFGLPTDHDHGTAVLGIFSGDHNGLGIQGLSPEAVAKAASATFSAPKWNAAAAIQAAATLLQAGDVILLEMHGPGPHSAPGVPADQVGFVPVEFWRAERAAIAFATARGIHVVEAAGNGGEDLDHPDYQGTFDRTVFDSEAILVGGGAVGPPARSRLSWSNYGTRLDVQGWGENIATTGGRSEWYYHDLESNQDPSRCYTGSFGGTSGASPIVAGVVACISGILRAAGKPPLSPREMRDLLVATGTQQADGLGSSAASEKIGPLPNLAAALAQL
jgi:subtilisin family serine protease